MGHVTDHQHAKRLDNLATSHQELVGHVATLQHDFDNLRESVRALYDARDDAHTIEEPATFAEHDAAHAAIAAEVRAALEGDSNDAEHDALASVADFFGVAYGEPEDGIGVRAISTREAIAAERTEQEDLRRAALNERHNGGQVYDPDALAVMEGAPCPRYALWTAEERYPENTNLTLHPHLLAASEQATGEANEAPAWIVQRCVDLDTGEEFEASYVARLGEDKRETTIEVDRIIEALRAAHRNDSAADAVEFVSELVGWSAEDDDELKEYPDHEPEGMPRN